MSVFLRLAFISIIGLTSLSSVAWAQQAAESSEPELYRVEVVIFTQPPISDQQAEQPPATPPPLPRGLAWPLRAPDTPGLGYVTEAENTYRLADSARRIDAREGFEVLWHTAWVQPGWGRNRAQSVALPSALAEKGLTGQIKIYRERFLHAYPQLRLAPDWVFEQSRRMRSGEQHYLDHPAMGVIVRIDEVSQPPTNPAPQG